MPLRSYRRRVLGLAAAVYLIGLLVVVLTGIPSALAVALILIAAAAWAGGPVAGGGTMAVTVTVEFILLHWLSAAGRLQLISNPIAVMVPVIMTEIVIIVAMSALRRAELRQAAAEAELRRQNAALEEAIAEVRELRGMLPICAWCKSIRNVNGMWDKLEAYLSKHSRATLTHGICPSCTSRLEAESRTA